MSFFPALMFEPDAYTVNGPKLMGRQSAGSGFLRAFLDAADEQAAATGTLTLNAWTPSRQAAEEFIAQVGQKSARLNGAWLPSHKPDLLAQVGGLFMPGPNISNAARQRLRVGPAAWCLTGLTHTLCSHGAMDSIVEMLVEPVMPWDALICTSSSAKQVVQNLFALQAEYLNWRFGAHQFMTPLLPVIPLGVHAADFDFSVATCQQARLGFNLAPDQVAVLFAGRLSFHAKAHPYPMLTALQQAAERSGQSIVLLLCGQFPNTPVKQAFLEGAARYAPAVRTQWIDGEDAATYRRAWAASDIFVSLSDNLQETFGITPLEAMASGLPALVSDWDGYKDTVTDGVEGFRVPTWMPPPDLGTALAMAYEAGTINYDRYIGLASLQTSLDQTVLTDRLTELVSNPELRARMGAAGKARVMAHYDWPVVMKQYRALWQEQQQMRRQAVAENPPHLSRAPRAAATRQDPYRVFDGFPTRLIRAGSRVQRGAAPWRKADWSVLCADPLFSFAGRYLPDEATVAAILALVETPVTVATLAQALKCPVSQLIGQLAPMAKLGWIRLSALSE